MGFRFGDRVWNIVTVIDGLSAKARQPLTLNLESQTLSPKDIKLSDL